MNFASFWKIYNCFARLSTCKMWNCCFKLSFYGKLLTKQYLFDIMFKHYKQAGLPLATSNSSPPFPKSLSCLIFRGVAQLVARQFRVLEAASSSPATSTKKRTDIPCGCLFFFACGEDESSPMRKAQNASSHIPLKDRQARLSGAERGYIQLCWKSRHNIFDSIASSPTARKHSRCASLDQLTPSTPCFARARRYKQLSTVSNLLTRHFDQNKKCQIPWFYWGLTLFYFWYYLQKTAIKAIWPHNWPQLNKLYIFCR